MTALSAGLALVLFALGMSKRGVLWTADLDGSKYDGCAGGTSASERDQSHHLSQY
jgi:hypothetical protein